MFSKRLYTALFTCLFIFSHASIGTAASISQNNAAEFEDVIVRFKDKPGQAELHAFKGLGGAVTNVLTIIPAISGTLPAKAI